MAKYIVKKVDDKIYSAYRSVVLSKKEYILPNEVSNSNLLPTYNDLTVSNEEYCGIRVKIDSMLNNILADDNGFDRLTEIYSRLKYIKTEEDAMDIVKSFDSLNREVLKNNLKVNTTLQDGFNTGIQFENVKFGNIVISMFIKKFIKFYYTYLISTKSKLDINSLEIFRLENKNLESIFEQFGDKFDDVLNENGEVVKPVNKEIKELCGRVLLHTIDTIHDTSISHLCWDVCSYARANMCPKVADKKKKDISEYDFIKSGYQLFDSNKKLNKFYVSRCDLCVCLDENLSKEEIMEEEEKRILFIHGKYLVPSGINFEANKDLRTTPILKRRKNKRII